jgi:homogentisate 1,2-dioxygenase
MVDTFRPLELGEGGQAVDDGVYARSWAANRAAGAAGAAGAAAPADGSDYSIG